MTRIQAAKVIAMHMRAAAKRAVNEGMKPQLNDTQAQTVARTLAGQGTIDVVPHWTTVRDAYREMYDVRQYEHIEHAMLQSRV